MSGFRESRWKIVQKIKKGDRFLCYLTGVSRFIAILEVTGESFTDTSKIWADEDFPCRVRVTPLVQLSVETAVPVRDLSDKLSFFEGSEHSGAWTGHFRGSPTKWKVSDGEAVEAALLDAKANPVSRPYDERKLRYRPKAIAAKIGTETVSVTVPESSEESESTPETPTSIEPSAHTEIQWLLLKLSSDMGFHIWVAKNDKSKEYKGKKFCELPKLKGEIPLQFDDATNQTIQLIDVLWLKGNAIIAAFEVESTTSIYSGLLRMSDLVAMQPNLTIPLYLVAPDERRDKVLSEVNRPTFSRLSPPLSKICRYISFSGLREGIERAAPYLRFLKPEFLEEISESCVLEEA